jgi:two-component system LytT family sensor kinase
MAFFYRINLYMLKDVPTILTEDLSALEHKLHEQDDPKQRLVLIDQLASYYAFTNVKRASSLVDELFSILQQHPNPDLLLNYYLYKATLENQRYEYEQAEIHFQKAIELLKERGTVKQQAETYIDYAGTSMNLGQMDQATELLNRADKALKNFPDNRLLGRITCREGFMQLHYSNYSKAIELFLAAEKSINMLQPPLGLKDYYFLTLIYSGLGKVYERNDDREKSVDAYLKVVQMCEDIGIKTRLSWHYLNVGIGYIALNDQKRAEAYFLKAIDISDDSSEHARASAYANLGFCYYEKEHFTEALELFDRAEQLYQSISSEDYYNFSIIGAWRGRLYAEIDKPQEAIKYYKKALKDAQRIEDFKQLSGVCKEFASLYAQQKDYQNAYKYQCLHAHYAEEYNSQVDKQKQMEVEVKYEAEKKKQETEMLRLQATRLQLKALRAQMNPHFMYNALNSIQNYITSNEITSAAKYLAKFAQLMRRSLEYSELEIISLEEEIEFLEEYLYINEKLRFEDRLKYEIIIDEEIEEDILGVPTMIVQPYVENAIEHGLRTRSNGLIKIFFFLFDEDTILCVVEDNGIGRAKAHQLRMKDPQYQNHRSRGTNITEKRLAILNNSKNNEEHINIIDLIDKDTQEAKGTRVEIKIPVIEIQIR